MSGNSVIRHTDGNYYIVDQGYDNPGLPPGYVPKVLGFIKHLQTEIADYYRHFPNRFINYEDIYYVANQIADSESREYDNPVVQPFIDKLSTGVKLLNSQIPCARGHAWTIQEFAVECSHYVRDIVWNLLSQEPHRIDHLQIIEDAIKEAPIVHIHTLNHDTLIEQFLKARGRQYIDGFGTEDGGVRYWNSHVFSASEGNTHLYKLHGSIDWFRLRPDKGTWYDEKIGIPVIQDFWHTRTPDGRLQLPLDGRPIFLAGTFNKILQYIDEIYIDLHCHFVRSLRRVNYVVVSGYGFGDKAINSYIIRWLYDNTANRLIVLHPDPDTLKDAARGAIGRPWTEWVQSGKLVTIK